MNLSQKSTDNEDQSFTNRATVLDCLNSWNTYLQVLNTLCTAGLKLSQNLNSLIQSNNVQLSTQFMNSWEELAKATVIATSSVKTHVLTSMQSLNLKETSNEQEHAKKLEYNREIINENVTTFINLQYQFSIAGCEAFNTIATCVSCYTNHAGFHATNCPMRTLQKCFEKLVNKSSRTSPFSDFDSINGRSDSLSNHSLVFENGQQRRSKSPLNYQLFPVVGQRRWSEAAATTSGDEEAKSKQTLRRWSMPWDDVKNNQEDMDLGPNKFIMPQFVFSTSDSDTCEHNESRSVSPDIFKDNCPSPAVPSNSRFRVSNISLKIGTKVTYQCDDGYELFGDNTRICSDKGIWTGDLPFCGTNVALRKPTNQSTTVRGGSALNANDGEKTTIHDGRQCSETLKEISPWWKVDLLRPYTVKLVRITTRGCCGHQPLRDLEIRVGNSSFDLQKNPLCAWFPGTLEEGATKVFHCARQLVGQFVFLQLVGVDGSLSLCEVEVFSTEELSTDRCISNSVSLDEEMLLSTFDRKCYEFGIRRGASFDEARNYCLSRNGDLIHGSRSKIVQFLYSELDRRKSTMKTQLVWIGVQKEPGITSKIWKWVNGKVVEKPSWGKDQPNNYNGEQNCAVLDGGRNWLWNDVGCSLDYLHWICQFEPYSCGSPDKQENTKIIGDSFGVRSIIRYECPVGYKLIGNVSRICQLNGTWSGSSPSCKFIDCGDLPEFGNGVLKLIDNRTTYNAQVEYSCWENYTLIGNKQRTCNDDGLWTESGPKCMYDWCPEPQEIAGASYQVNGYRTGSIVTYKCDQGYLLQGQPTLNCNLGGEWTGKVPNCKYIDCGSPSRIDNGAFKLINESTSFESIVEYSCNMDYWMVGDAVQMCTKEGKWSSDTPSCELITCEDPDVPSGGLIIGYDFNVNSKIEFQCEPGHLLRGKSSLVCNRNGLWSDSIPSCEFIDCGKVPSLVYGTVEYVNSSTYLGSAISYHCVSNYRLIGTPLRYCQESREWSNTSPKCEEIRCPEPTRPEHSVLSVTGNDRIYGRTSIRTADNAGDGSTYKIGAMVKYRCEKGYKVSGEALSTCEDTGRWSGVVPECQFVDCGYVDGVENGKVSLPSNATYYGATVLYSCNENYELNGVSRRLCQENGTWSSEVPICKEIMCKEPENNDNILHEVTSLRIGGILKYSCPKGFKLDGNRTRICTNKGYWSGKKPVCNLIDCNHPGFIEYGRVLIVNGTTTYNSAIEYHCIAQFERVGPYLRKCLDSGEWSGDEPRCQKATVENQITSGLVYSVGIGSAVVFFLLILLILIYLKLRKPVPVKNTENIEGIERKEDKNAAVMSYATLNDGHKSYFIQPKYPNMYGAPDDHTYDSPYEESVNYESVPQNGGTKIR